MLSVPEGSIAQECAAKTKQGDSRLPKVTALRRIPHSPNVVLFLL